MILVDARALANPLTGVGRYAGNLLQRFPTLDGVRGVRKPGVTDGYAELAVDVLGSSVPDALWNETSLSRVLPLADSYWAPHSQVPWRRARGTRIASVVHDLVHREDVVASRFHRWSRENAIRASVARADVLITTTAHMSAQLGRHYGRVADVIIPPGPTLLDPDADEVTRLRDELDQLPAKRWVLAVGTDSPRKNHHRLAEAVVGLPGVALALVGGEAAGFRSGSPHVLRTGYVSQQRLAAWFAVADCLAYPSLAEGFGLPISDARRVGLRVVASARPPMCDVAGPESVLVDPESVQSIRDGVSRALELGPTTPALLAKWSDGAAVLHDILCAR